MYDMYEDLFIITQGQGSNMSIDVYVIENILFQNMDALLSFSRFRNFKFFILNTYNTTTICCLMDPFFKTFFNYSKFHKTLSKSCLKIHWIS